MEEKEGTCISLQQLEDARRRLAHVPTISSSGKQMAVWSDVKEALFQWCPGPACFSMLIALKHLLGYPATDSGMHPCTQLEQLMFMKLYTAVTPGTLLVDINTIKTKRDLMLLNELLKIRHCNTKDPTIRNCNEMRTKVTTNCHTEVPPNDVTNKMFLPSIRRETHKPKVREKETWSVLSKDGKMRFRRSNPRQTRSSNSLTEGPPMSTVEETSCQVQEPASKEELVPLSLLRDCFPVCQTYLDRVMQAYVLGRCTDHMASISKCTVEEARQITQFLAGHKGFEVPWTCVTSCSVMLSWADFYVGYSSRPGAFKLLPMPAEHNPVVTLSCQDIRSTNPDNVTASRNRQRQKPTHPSKPSLIPLLQRESKGLIHKELQNVLKPIATTAESTGDGTLVEGLIKSREVERQKALNHGHITDVENQNSKKISQTQRTSVTDFAMFDKEVNSSDTKQSNKCRADTRFDTSKKCNELTEKATRCKDTSFQKDYLQETKVLKRSSSRSCVRVTRSSVNISCRDSGSVEDMKGKSKRIIVNDHSEGTSKIREKSLKNNANNSAFKGSACKREPRETVSDANLAIMQSTSQKHSKCKGIINDFENSETHYGNKSIQKVREEKVPRGRRNISEEFESSENDKINELENEEEEEQEGILDSFHTHGIEVSITPKKRMNFTQENDQASDTVGTENQTPAITKGLNKNDKGNASPTDKYVLKVSAAKINENLPLKLRVKKHNLGKQAKVVYFANYRDKQGRTVQESDNKVQETNKKAKETDKNDRKESSRDEYTPPKFVSLMPKKYEIKTPKSQPQTPTEKSPYKAAKPKSETHQNGNNVTPHQGNVQTVNNSKITNTNGSHPFLHGSPMYVIGRLAREAPAVSVPASLPGPLNPIPKPRSVSASAKLPDEIVSNLKEQASKSFCSTRGNATVKALEQELQIEGNDMKITEFQSERMTMWQDKMKPTEKDKDQGRLCKSADPIRRKEKGYTYIPTSSIYSHTSDGSNEKHPRPLFRTALCAVYSRPRSQSPLKTDMVSEESKVNATKGTTRLSTTATKISKPKASTIITAVCPNYGSSSSKSPDIYDEFARRRRPKISTSPTKTKLIGQGVARPVQVPQCKTDKGNVQCQPEKPPVTLSYQTASSTSLSESTAQRQSQDQVSQGGVTFQQKYSHATASTPLNLPYASFVQNYTEPSDPQYQARHPSCIMCNHSQEQAVRREESSSKALDSEKNECVEMRLLEKVGSFADNMVAPKQSDSLESIDNLKSIMNMNFTAEISEVIKRGKSCIEEVCKTNCYPFKHTEHVATSLQESFQPFIADASDNLQTDTGEKIARIDSQLYFGMPGQNELFKVAGDVSIPANAQFYMQASHGEYTQALSSTSSWSDTGEGGNQVFLKKLQSLRENTEQQNECTATKMPQDDLNNVTSSQSTLGDEEGIVSALSESENLIKQTPTEVDSLRWITPSSRKINCSTSKPEKSFQDFVEENRAARRISDEEARQKKSLASSQVQYLKDSGNGRPKKAGKHTTIPGPKCSATSQKPKGSVSGPALPGKPRPKTTSHLRNKSKVHDRRQRPKTTSSLNTNNVSEIDEKVPTILPIENDIEEKKRRSKKVCSRQKNTKGIGRPKASQSGPQIKRTISSRLSKSAKQSNEVIEKQRNSETRDSCEETYQVVSALRRLSLDGSFGILSKKAEARKTKLRSFVKSELKSPICSPNSAVSLMQNPSDALQNASSSDHVINQGSSISRKSQASSGCENKYGRYGIRISYKGNHENDVVKDSRNETIANTCEPQSNVGFSYQNSLTKKNSPSFVKGNTEATANYSSREVPNDSETPGIICDSFMCYLNSNENNGVSEESDVTGKEYSNLPLAKHSCPSANDKCGDTAIPVIISPCISVENRSRFEFCEVPYTFFNNASTDQQDSAIVYEDSEEIQEASEPVDGQENNGTIISIENTLDTNGELFLNLSCPDGSVYHISHEDPSYLSLVKFYEDQKLANVIKREQMHEELQNRNQANFPNIQENSPTGKNAEEFNKETSDKVWLTEIHSSNGFCHNNGLGVDCTPQNCESCANISADYMWNSDAPPPHLVKEEPLQYEENDSCDAPDIEQQNECTVDNTSTANLTSYETINAIDPDKGIEECENGCHHLPSVEIDVDEYVIPAYYEEQEIVTAPVEDGHEYEHCQYELVNFDSIDNFNEVTIVAESDQTANGTLTETTDELLNKNDSPDDPEINKNDILYHPKRDNSTLPQADKSSIYGISDQAFCSPETVVNDKDCVNLGVDISSETEVSKQTKSNTSLEKLKQCLMKTCNKMTENTPLFSETHHSEKVNQKGSESVVNEKSVISKELEVKTLVNNCDDCDNENISSSLAGKPKQVDSYSDVNSVTDSELDYEADDDERDEDYVPEDSDEKAVSEEEDIGDIYDDVRKINQSLGIYETPKRAYKSKKKALKQSKSEIEKIYRCKVKSVKKPSSKKKAAVSNRKTKPRQRVASESENNGGYSLDERAGISESGNDTDSYFVKERCLPKTSESEPCIGERLLVTDTKQADSSEKKKKAKSKSRLTKKSNKHKDDVDENDSSKEDGKLAEGFIKTQKIYLDIIKNNNNKPTSEPTLDDGEKSLEVVKEVPSGIPLHGDRVVTKAIADAEKAMEGTGSLSDDHEPDVIEDLTNSCKYQLVEDEDHINLGGVAYFRSFSLPFVYINGYKYIPLRDALTLFQPGHCVSCCTIPRSVLQKSKQLVRTFSTWEQVYKFELIKMKKGPSIKTGDVVVKLDSLLSALPRLVTEIVHLHYNTKLKRSQKCDIDSYRNFNSVNKKKC